MSTAVDDLVAAGADEIKRDHYGRPLIKPSTGSGKEKAYTRVTTLAQTLEDQFNLTLWKQRMTMLGIVDRPDLLLLAAAADRDDKTALNRIVNDAVEAAAWRAKANIGTALHRFCERLDKGEELGPIPGDFAADVRAYERAMTGVERVAVERFVVLDDIEVAGTADRILRIDGECFIGDIKTGSLHGGQSMAMQLALYAHGMFYDLASGERTPLPGVSSERGVIIHLPAGEGRAMLHWIDLRAAWELVPFALRVREWRKRKDLLTPLNVEAAVSNIADAGLLDTPSTSTNEVDEITAQLRAAQTPAELIALWERYSGNGWTDAHTAAAAARKASLQ